MSEKKTRILQMGLANWRTLLSDEQSQEMEWHFLNLGEDTVGFREGYAHLMKKQAFDVVLCTDVLDNALLKEFSELIESYRLIIDQRLEAEVSSLILGSKVPFFLNFEDQNEVIETLRQFFFPSQLQQGSKFHTSQLLVSRSFKGTQHFYGQNYLELNGLFSEASFSPLLSWQYNIEMRQKGKKIWLEFEHDPTVSLRLSVIFIQASTGEVVKRRAYQEDEFKTGLEIASEANVDYLGLCLTASGEGMLRVGALHYRDSRGSYGEYLPGGQKLFDERKQELFYYFHPGNLKPPLTVYFSGYRSAEGFEGFQMMKKLGHPFLLFTDPRLEGGAFYLGSDTLEQGVIEVIQEQLHALGFDRKQLVLSGLSMGTFGALYYGSQLLPHTIIAGKPLVNLGTMAENSKLVRPGQFETSLDLLYLTYQEVSDEAISLLNQRFWSRFDQSNFSETQLKVAYMKNDDYDSKAYPTLLEHLLSQRSKVIGKGIPGRHNDRSSEINEWFLTQYRETLEEFSEATVKATQNNRSFIEPEEGEA
ncbi:Accessory secretory protein Asp2 [Lactococcus lactis subsp. lactis]|uniref:accessory Sec system protein Asp2 n=1 Tax=Lactococcus lactis TaxID=1358 RepID=UPI0007247E6F|nr:accessory Sec system protein Asp2 [Lactococcus lactis]KST88016.1 Accessory secretory protein Asp2 [Lactococcus lactis subsp. lactis]